MHEDEMDAVLAVLVWARSGDTLILPMHGDRHAVLEFLSAVVDSDSNTGKL